MLDDLNSITLKHGSGNQVPHSPIERLIPRPRIGVSVGDHLQAYMFLTEKQI